MKLRFLVLALCAACNDPQPLPDAGTDAGTAPTCDEDPSICDDGLFCNGVEACASGECAAGEEPCLETQTCDEAMDACLSDCERAPDADGDGADAESCGGDDCDDGDPDRFPSNMEVCNLGSPRHDEDCDASTFGDRDSDGDTYVDLRCCNVDDAGIEACGNDCDDSAEDTHPDTADTCDGFDTDCDGVIDDGTQVAGCADLDHDLHGDADAPTMACPGAPDFSTVCDDCDDTNAARYAGLSETCDHFDNDCNDVVDEGVTVSYYADCDNDDRGAGAAVPLCPSDTVPECMGNPHVTTSDDCDDTCPTCFPGGTEVCDGEDNDCAGGVDNGALPGIGVGCTVSGASGECASGTTRCESGAMQCRGPSPVAETCGDGRDFDCDGSADEEGACVGPTACTDGTCGFPGDYTGCDACRRVNCEPRVDRTFTEDGFTTCSGSFVIGSSRLVWCGDTSCYVQFGPYVRLPVGTYEVTLNVHGNNGWFHGFEYDVSFPDGGGRFLSAGPGGVMPPGAIPNGARYWITGNDMANLITLRFRVDSPCVRTEFRVFYLRATTDFLNTCTGTNAAFAVNSRRVVRVGP